MDNKSKIAIFILVLIVIFFFLTIGLGGINQRSSDSALAKQRAENGDYPDWIENMGDLLSPYAPKIKLDSDRFDLNPGATPLVLRVSPDRQPIRTATFMLASGQKIRLTYQNFTPNPLTDRQKPLELPRQQGRQLNRGSIVIAKEGGTLQLECQGVVPCQVKLP